MCSLCHACIYICDVHKRQVSKKYLTLSFYKTFLFLCLFFSFFTILLSSFLVFLLLLLWGFCCSFCLMVYRCLPLFCISHRVYYCHEIRLYYRGACLKQCTRMLNQIVSLMVNCTMAFVMRPLCRLLKYHKVIYIMYIVYISHNASNIIFFFLVYLIFKFKNII